MKLIPRRKQTPSTFERVVGYAKLGVKGLAAQRFARRVFRGYKFTRRAVPLAGLAALGAVIARKARGGSAPATPSYSPPPSPSTTPSPVSTSATGTSPGDDGAPAAGPDVTDALEDAGVEGSGPDTPKEAAAPGVGDEQPPTDDTLDVEAPNESTPPPPEKAKKT